MKHLLLSPSHSHSMLHHHTHEYDNSFQRDSAFTTTGMILLLVFFISSIIVQGAIANNAVSSSILYSIYGTIALLIRMGVAPAVATYAKKLNRNARVWSVLAFCFPAITLIVIGQKHKYLA